MSNVAFSLDWVKCTFVHTGDETECIPPMPENEQMTESRGIGSYNAGLENRFFSVSWHTERPEQKVMLQLTGKQLSEYRKAGGEEKNILRFCLERAGAFTRLDFAVDIMDSEGKPEDIYDAWGTPSLITSARSANIIQGQNESKSTGTTVYLGSRQSLRMMRVYEKGKQMGVNIDWLRAELEFKGARATQMAHSMLTYGVEAGGVTHMRKFVQFTEVPWFEKSLSGKYDKFNIDSIGRPETDHERWIFEVVIPVVEKSVKQGLPGVLEALRAIISAHDDSMHHGPSLTPNKK